MPSIVRNLKPLERLPFVAGIVDTDWGRAGNSFGTHCASLPLIQDVIDTISDLANITFSPIKKFTQKGKYKSYQTRIRKRDFRYFLRIFDSAYPLKNKERVIYLRRGNAGVKVFPYRWQNGNAPASWLGSQRARLEN